LIHFRRNRSHIPNKLLGIDKLKKAVFVMKKIIAIALSSVFLLSACQSVEVTQEGAILTADASSTAQITWLVYNDEFVTEHGTSKTLTAAFLQDWPSDDLTLLAYENEDFGCGDDATIPADAPLETEFCTELMAIQSAYVGLFEGGKIAAAEVEGNELDLDVTIFSGLDFDLPEGWDGCGYYVKAVVLSEDDFPGEFRQTLELVNSFFNLFEPNTTTTDFTCKDEVGLSVTTPATTTPPTPPTLAKTGAEVEWIISAGLITALAGAGFLTVSRRKRTA
jgi:LPXTG-motif cell wall-anchored protein